MTAHIVQGNALNLPYASGIAQTCVTSPPYYGLRDYGVCGQIGLEQTPAEYVSQIVAVMREVWRVLRDDGTLWLNLGDSYASATKGSGGGWALDPNNYTSKSAAYGARKFSHDVKDKDLLGIPWRVAFALQDDGWYLRSDIIWHKPNPMPESVTDRPTKAHEYVFLLTKQARYFYDAEAVKESAETAAGGCANSFRGNGANRPERDMTKIGIDGKRNARTVWTIATRPYSGAHFATMPPALAEKCILAGTSARGRCPTCGKAWVRVCQKSRATYTRTNDPTLETGRAGMNRGRVGLSERYVLDKPQPELAKELRDAARGREDEMLNEFGSKWQHWIRTDANGSRVPTFRDAERIEALLGVKINFAGMAGGWRPACACPPHDPVPCIVLDPFSGSGTTMRVAAQHRRNFIGTELNPAYIALTPDRVTVQTQF